MDKQNYTLREFEMQVLKENCAGRQHLKLTKEDGQESLGIEGGAEAFFLETDSFAHVGIFTKSQCGFAKDV